MADKYATTPMERVLSAMCEADVGGLSLTEVIMLAWNAETTDDFMEAVSLYTIGDIDVTGCELVIVKD